MLLHSYVFGVAIFAATAICPGQLSVTALRRSGGAVKTLTTTTPHDYLDDLRDAVVGEEATQDFSEHLFLEATEEIAVSNWEFMDSYKFDAIDPSMKPCIVSVPNKGCGRSRPMDKFRGGVHCPAKYCCSTFSFQKSEFGGWCMNSTWRCWSKLKKFSYGTCSCRSYGDSCPPKSTCVDTSYGPYCKCSGFRVPLNGKCVKPHELTTTTTTEGPQ